MTIDAKILTGERSHDHRPQGVAVPNHFSSIGFAVDSMEEFHDLAVDAAQHGEEVPASSGRYLVWRPSDGVELWAQADGDALRGLEPYFAGGSRVRLGITSRVKVKGQGKLDATLYAWVAPDDEEEPASGMYPLVIDAIGLAADPLPRLPAVADVEVTTFAHDLDWWPDLAAYEAMTAAETEPQLAAEACIPGGTFQDPPEADALFVGSLVDGGLRTNAQTQRPFWAGRLRTLGGEIDVVADPVLLGDGAPSAGAIVRVAGWVAGRVHGARSVAPPPRGLGRLLRRR